VPPGSFSIAPRLHSIIAYGGAFVVFPAVALLAAPGLLAWPSPALSLGLLLWAIHFARRIVEAAWVHRSTRPIPLGGLLAYPYYWVQGGFIAASLASPEYEFAFGPRVALGLMLFAAAEVGNAWCHLRLRALRAPGEAARRIPRGGPFELVSSPHYLFEIVAWWAFALALPCAATLVFATATTAILVSWGRDRHRAYLEQFDGKEGRALYPPERRALLPFLL
jgi:very-long-chain enoyl-CoA reductase